MKNGVQPQNQIMTLNLKMIFIVTVSTLLAACEDNSAEHTVSFGALQNISHQEYREAVNNKAASSNEIEAAYKFGYVSVAYFHTPLLYGRPKHDSNKQVSGILTGIRALGNAGKDAALTAKYIAEEKSKYGKQKEEALINGLKTWEKLARRGHLQSQIGLAWHFGTTEQHEKAYLWRSIAVVNGDINSNQYADYHKSKLSSESVASTDAKIKRFSIVAN